jgi:hypothetical protein
MCMAIHTEYVHVVYMWKIVLWMGISEFICTTLEMVMFVYYENDFLKAAKSPIPGKVVQRR